MKQKRAHEHTTAAQTAKRLAAAALSLALIWGIAPRAQAADMPTGGSVVTGADALTGFTANPASGATISNTANALINWKTFNIAQGNTLNFNTASGTVLMNQVTGSDMSRIAGLLNDTGAGHLILANPNGIIVEPTGVINANYLTLMTIQNLDATGFAKFTSGGWGPEVSTNDGVVAFASDATNPSESHATVNVNRYLGVLAGTIVLDDYVAINTNNSTLDLTAVKNGQYSLLMGDKSFYSNGVQYTATNNAVKIGNNTLMNVNGNSYNQISVLGGQVKVGDYALFNTGSDPSMSSVLIQAVATKNDSESDPSKVYTASEQNVILMRLGSFTNGNFKLIGGSLAGETESFKDNFTKVGGATPEPDPPTPPTPPDPPTPPTPPDPPTPPTPPDPPTPPTPPTPDPGDLNKAKAQQEVLNLLDSSRTQYTVMETEQRRKGALEGVTPTEARKALDAARKSQIAALKRLKNAGKSGDQDEIAQAREALEKANQELKDARAAEKAARNQKPTEPVTVIRPAESAEGAGEAGRLMTVEEARKKQIEASKNLIKAGKSGGKEEFEKAKEALKKANDDLKAAREAARRESEAKKELEELQKKYDRIRDSRLSRLLEEDRAEREARAKEEAEVKKKREELEKKYERIRDARLSRLLEEDRAEREARAKEEAEVKKKREELEKKYERIRDARLSKLLDESRAEQEARAKKEAEVKKKQEAKEAAKVLSEAEQMASEAAKALSKAEQMAKEAGQETQDPAETTSSVVQSGGERPEALKKLDDIIGKELIDKENAARRKLIKAKTSAEREQAMKELEEIKRQETEKVKAVRADQAQKPQEATQQPQQETQPPAPSNAEKAAENQKTVEPVTVERPAKSDKDTGAQPLTVDEARRKQIEAMNALKKAGKTGDKDAVAKASEALKKANDDLKAARAREKEAKQQPQTQQPSARDSKFSQLYHELEQE